MRKKRLGDLIRESGLVDDIQFRSAIGFHHKWGVPLGQVLVDKGFCTAQQVLELLSQQLGLPTVDLDQQSMPPILVDVLPVEVAESCRVVPLWTEGPRDSVLVVAAAAPAHPPALDAVARAAGKSRVVAKLATDGAITRAIDRLYYPHLLGAQRPIEPIPLPEADEHLPLVTDRAEYLSLGRMVPTGLPAATQERDGLSFMTPLSMELPAHARLTDPGLSRAQVGARGLAPAEAEPEVWVYGWGAKATEDLLELLQDEGLRVKVARTEDVVKASPRAVVLAPVQSVEPVKRQGIWAQLVLAGKVHDGERAAVLGARAFLPGPLRTEVLLREVHALVEEGHSALRRVG